MVEIRKGVGDGGQNSVDDAALIQAMLVLAKSAAGKGYLDRYDGVVGKGTKEAILAFQLDQKLIAKGSAADKNPAVTKAPTAGQAAAPPPAAGIGKGSPYLTLVAGAVPGLVNPNDPTFAKLMALIPPTFKDIHTLPGGKTVYLPEDEATMKASRDAVTSEAGFVADFRDKVALLVETIWKSTKIVVRIAGKTGTRRDFETQYQLTFQKDAKGNPVTHAGPGESNHNFGQAVDLGFESLRWLGSHGEVVTKEDSWLHKLDPTQAATGEAGRFWALLRDVGTKAPVGLNRGPVSDHPHLQTWDDSKVHMPERLAALLTQVGAAKWKGAQGVYRTDFGMGGNYYFVGTAKAVWGGNAMVFPPQLAEAMTAKAKAAASKAGPLSPEWKNFKTVAAKNVTAKQVKEMQELLRSDFRKADKAWTQWTPY
jgi:hypothetical protein